MPGCGLKIFSFDAERSPLVWVFLPYGCGEDLHLSLPTPYSPLSLPHLGKTSVVCSLSGLPWANYLYR